MADPTAARRRTRTPPSPLVVSACDARRLLLHAQGLLHDPAAQRPATPRAVARLVEQMGFVQVDTISTVERAHHLILAARTNGYRPAMLADVLERDRRLFEHWTHDASVIPLKWFPHWRHRFERYRDRGGSWHRKQLGPDADRVLAIVLERITREGPRSSRDFEHAGSQGPRSWWGWKPQKVALDHLWRCGVLTVSARRNFHKVYDLTERVIPKHAALPTPSEPAHVDWACRTALQRLGTATTREIAQFWAAVSRTRVAEWLTAATASGEVVPVLVQSADGSAPVHAYALSDIRHRIAALPEPPAGIRLLSPFDPVLRDRARAKRLFNFDFRFEGFVPATDRKHGYYVMAVLDGDRFVAKADPKFDRRTGILTVRNHWWEAPAGSAASRAKRFGAGVEQLGRWIGARAIEVAR